MADPLLALVKKLAIHGELRTRELSPLARYRVSLEAQKNQRLIFTGRKVGKHPIEKNRLNRQGFGSWSVIGPRGLSARSVIFMSEFSISSADPRSQQAAPTFEVGPDREHEPSGKLNNVPNPPFPSTKNHEARIIRQLQLATWVIADSGGDSEKVPQWTSKGRCRILLLRQSLKVMDFLEEHASRNWIDQRLAEGFCPPGKDPISEFWLACFEELGVVEQAGALALVSLVVGSGSVALPDRYISVQGMPAPDNDL